METGLILAVGMLYAAAIYCMLRRSTVRLSLGLVLLGSATNLALFTTNKVTRSGPPLLPKDGLLAGPVADPVPQAFILTAIVINFGMLALLLVLVHLAERTVGSDEMKHLNTEVPPPSAPNE
ncbi:multisubunit sodium/proton antiporter, MrpC subunit [Stigmatella aurantiaca]|uniref:Multisubunit sodium/proton antiporter, MrpC subunit n=1 Tax=Stigmatella aurantiaca TaxID=41 RepID=A0A1H7PCS4_STIAU|nr:NADH-quinone oxidoreductase subunit K [Stigmatella aurantiaca]SEL33562.1 multisubunit sodium/proton antiporter, MrpC subunit [Stigmatella aurantiaca]